MPKEKFNPIAQIPNLPGATIQDLSDIMNKDMESHTPPPKYPPTEVFNNTSDKPMIEIRLKKLDQSDPEAPKEPTKDEKKAEESIGITRIVIFIILIVLIFAGIYFTLRIVPALIGKISNSSQSFTSLFISKNTATPVTNSENEVPATVPVNTYVATSTAIVPAATSTTSYKPAVAAGNGYSGQNPTNYTQPKTPARIVSSVISATPYGNRTIVRFNIQNVGGTTSGAWSFSVALPSSVTPVYYSQIQNALTPQSGVIYTLQFTQDQYANAPIQVTIH